MDNMPKNITLPNIEEAMKDLEEYKSRYQASAENLKKISNEVENLKVEKQALKADIDGQKRIIKYYTDLHVKLAAKIEKTSINQNKAKLVKLSNVEKIKQSEAKVVEHKIDLNEYDNQFHQSPGLEISKEDLLLEKKRLKQVVVDNKQHMQDLLNKFKLKV